MPDQLRGREGGREGERRSVGKTRRFVGRFLENVGSKNRWKVQKAQGEKITHRYEVKKKR